MRKSLNSTKKFRCVCKQPIILENVTNSKSRTYLAVMRTVPPPTHTRCCEYKWECRRLHDQCPLLYMLLCSVFICIIYAPLLLEKLLNKCVGTHHCPLTGSQAQTG